MLERLKSAERVGLVMCLAVLVSFATVLRLHGLGRWSLWLDEFIQYMESALPLNKLHEASHKRCRSLSCSDTCLSQWVSTTTNGSRACITRLLVWRLSSWSSCPGAAWTASWPSGWARGLRHACACDL